MRSFFTTILTLCLSLAASAQGSKVFDNLTMKCKLPGGERKFALYLPPGYDTSERSYPVLYLLHGMGDDQSGWIQFGEVQRIADKAIADGTATPMIIVMPDGNTTQVGYYNHPEGSYNYEDYFFNELIPHIEKTYRVRAEKRFRAIAGLSMGGSGTLVYALHHPELFAAACPLSAAMRHSDGNDAMRAHYAKLSPKKSEQQIKEWWTKNYDILSLVEAWPEENLNAVRWYIDCGDDDFLTEGNALLHIAMLNKKIPHEFRMRDGAHTWTYWREALPEVLRFISESFHQK